MNTQVHTKKALPVSSTTDSSYGDLKSRQFEVQSPPPTSAAILRKTGDLQTQLSRAERFGHNLSQLQVHPHGSSAPPLQKSSHLFIQPQIVEKEQKRDEEMETDMRGGVQAKSDDGLRELIEQAPMPDLSPKDSGNPLPKNVQTKMEKSFGTSFSDVRVHEGPQAKSVGALAYTQGNRIHFAPGQYNPSTPSGQALLGHELTHVVQQRAGRVPIPTQSKGAPINADPALEHEADEMGAKAARGDQAHVPGASFMAQMADKRRQPMQNSMQPVQFFFLGMLLGKLISPIIKMLFPDMGGGGGGGGGGGDSGGGGSGGADN
ncbi:DUF4157 domain-containing protein [Pantanalinema rosaneae CENA516]|uniref:eCIS core domain-containing protein n=1 Tax=Pantanalinema rosaneae TaxID=1620701 RepID=UPI003D6DDADB